MAAVQGADLICIPTNWVPMPDQPKKLPVMANILVMGAAHSNSVFIAAADRVGTERDQPFLGCSVIVSHTGWPLAGPASSSHEEIIFADINLSDARQKRALNAFNQPLRDRRKIKWRALALLSLPCTNGQLSGTLGHWSAPFRWIMFPWRWDSRTIYTRLDVIRETL